MYCLTIPRILNSKQSPPEREKNNFMCTLNINTVPIASARADDNGAYGKRGNVPKTYYLSENGSCQIAHQAKDNSYYIKNRVKAASSHPMYEDKKVQAERVYSLNRQYRYSKSNDFTNMIATITNMSSGQLHPYYLYLSKWKVKNLQNEEPYLVERHGNAKSPLAAPYY